MQELINKLIEEYSDKWNIEIEDFFYFYAGFLAKKYDNQEINKLRKYIEKPMVIINGKYVIIGKQGKSFDLYKTTDEDNVVFEKGFDLNYKTIKGVINRLNKEI